MYFVITNGDYWVLTNDNCYRGYVIHGKTENCIQKFPSRESAEAKVLTLKGGIPTIREIPDGYTIKQTSAEPIQIVPVDPLESE